MTFRQAQFLADSRGLTLRHRKGKFILERPTTGVRGKFHSLREVVSELNYLSYEEMEDIREGELDGSNRLEHNYHGRGYSFGFSGFIEE